MKKRDLGLVIDWETSGICDQVVPWRTYLEGPQGIELGAIAVYLPNFEVVGEFTSRVKFLGVANGVEYSGPLYEGLSWSNEAEAIHGMTPTALIDEPSPVNVAERFVNFVKDCFKIDDPHKSPVMLCGHNVAGDSYYTRQLLFLGGAERKLRFHYRMLDSFTMGYLLFGSRSSNDLFHLTSGAVRNVHHALDDARLTLQAFRVGCQKSGI